MISPLRTLCLLQPTPFCNIDCDYCYLPHRSSKNKMEVDTVGKIAMELFSSNIVTPPIDFLWHLGEPLAMPISFYEKSFSLIEQIAKDTGIEYSLTFQTNAMLVNKEWIKLFKKFNVKIGVSIDGPKFLHDSKRTTRKGKGSHDDVMKGIKLLQDSGISFGAIMVVTKESLDYPEEICNFFIENEIYDIGFNIDEMDGHNLTTSFSNVVDEKYKRFLKKLLEISVISNGRFSIREFWLNISPLMKEKTSPFNMANKPFRIFNFDYQGNYSTFCPELITADDESYNNFIMGNIHENPIDSIIENPIYNRVKNEIIEGLKKCENSCEYWSFCGGGCPSNKYFEHGNFSGSETIACKYHKMMVVDVLTEHFEEQLLS